MGGRLRRVIAALLLALQAGTLLPPTSAQGQTAGGGGTGTTAELRLVVHRPGVVWLDGRPVLDLTGREGPAPVPWSGAIMQETEVPAGVHWLRLKSADPRLLGWLDEQRVELAPGGMAVVPLGRPLLLTSPPGVAVALNDRELGTTPLRLDPGELPGGRLLLSHPGCVSDTLAADSLLARTRLAGQLRVELRAAPGVRGLPPGAPPRRYLGLSRWAAVGVSTALLAGGVVGAAHLKGLADDRFDVYRRTGDPARQREAFAAAQRYDRLSLIGWAVAEAGLLAAFYLIIQVPPRGMVPTVTAARGVAGEPAWQVGVRHAF